MIYGSRRKALVRSILRIQVGHHVGDAVERRDPQTAQFGCDGQPFLDGAGVVLEAMCRGGRMGGIPRMEQARIVITVNPIAGV